MMEAVFFSIFVMRQTPQELLAQILEAINRFINNPLFTEYGMVGLFINGVFSTFIPFPPEVTAISLVLAGISRTEIFAILVTSWIIGAAVGYYADRKSTRLNSSHANISYAVFCLKKNNYMLVTTFSN